ncbi:MAG TPA: ion channel [Ornithinibacter sp.]|nr:ion channel [Ornithinibacter sp.]
MSTDHSETAGPVEPPPGTGATAVRAVGPWPIRLWQEWRADPVDRFGVVLFFVIATIVVSSLINVDSSYGDSLLGHAMSGAALLAAARATGMRRRGRRVVTVAVLVAVGLLAFLSLVEVVAGESSFIGVPPRAADPLWLVLVIVVPIIVIRRIAQHTVVGGRTVLGAITAYLQIGVAYAALFQAVDVWSSVPAFGGPQESSTFTYLSLTTMSTLGIGDVVPTTELSRLLVSSEAVLGQVFLVTIVAIVVSQFAGGRTK